MQLQGELGPGNRFGVDLFISLFKSKTCPGVGVVGVVPSCAVGEKSASILGTVYIFGQARGRVGLIRILQKQKTESLQERLGPSGPSPSGKVLFSWAVLAPSVFSSIQQQLWWIEAGSPSKAAKPGWVGLGSPGAWQASGVWKEVTKCMRLVHTPLLCRGSSVWPLPLLLLL